ncbi:MAG TPA: hypothetical protein VHJ34_04030, partial [Actinomycetota bacterium]|nr:hypothetical protein [Actinomycetota bacterium]
LHSLAWSFGSVAGPAVAGVYLGAGQGVALFATLLIACGVGAVYSGRLERHLPARANVISEADAPQPEAARA